MNADFPRFPSAHHVALAIVAASRLTGEHAIACAAGAPGLRCRPIAFEALRAIWPEARTNGLGRCVGWRPSSTGGAIASARKAAWWNEDFVDEVVGALLANGEGRDDD